ncbi:DNA cytosine methyltransferase [Gallibacterium anatis]|uniref:DNA cytosine methyltransferase n=1 Tax=Gallibacterium anatis TaxID=750 RepID=UPI0005314CD8|nr:DNA cytosine methyltransferase [Gallibacterium anatis]KGQ25846.1 C-5 cytosine-specific DNA methylase [Gallibacterium anatis]
MYISFDNFIKKNNRLQKNKFNFISLFSSAGIADYGLEMAGGKCFAACELDLNRRKTHQENFDCPTFGDIKEDKDKIVNSFINQEIDLIIATPPCQSFSTANSMRGNRKDYLSAEKDIRNTLFLEAIYIINKLKPKFVIFENVPNFLERIIKDNNSGVIDKIGNILEEKLADYMGWKGSLCFSHFGVPQNRKRSLIIYIRRDLAQKYRIKKEQLNPLLWDKIIQDTPKNLLELFKDLPKLDSSSEECSYCKSDKLHIVPILKEHHYSWVKDIPAYSGKSAWENDCPNCHAKIEFGKMYCPHCSAPLTNRPHIKNADGSIRAIKGFKTSYRRMSASGLASTITTNSGAFSSDIKLHPVQNRVLSVRECALVQTIPYSFKWPEEQFIRKAHRIREMIGEAVPCAVTYHIGNIISNILNQQI